VQEDAASEVYALSIRTQTPIPLVLLLDHVFLTCFLPFYTVLQGVQEDTASEVYALSIFGTKTPVPLVLLLAAAVTLATGIGEEALFRGLIQQGLAQVP